MIRLIGRNWFVCILAKEYISNKFKFDVRMHATFQRNKDYN